MVDILYYLTVEEFQAYMLPGRKVVALQWNANAIRNNTLSEGECLISAGEGNNAVHSWTDVGERVVYEHPHFYPEKYVSPTVTGHLALSICGYELWQFESKAQTPQSRSETMTINPETGVIAVTVRTEPTTGPGEMPDAVQEGEVSARTELTTSPGTPPDAVQAPSPSTELTMSPGTIVPDAVQGNTPSIVEPTGPAAPVQSDATMVTARPPIQAAGHWDLKGWEGYSVDDSEPESVEDKVSASDQAKTIYDAFLLREAVGLNGEALKGVDVIIKVTGQPIATMQRMLFEVVPRFYTDPTDAYIVVPAIIAHSAKKISDARALFDDLIVADIAAHDSFIRNPAQATEQQGLISALCADFKRWWASSQKFNNARIYRMATGSSIPRAPGPPM
jgi:hypothetical protein